MNTQAQPALVYDKRGTRYEWNASCNAYWSVSGEPRQLQPGEQAPSLTIAELAQTLDIHACIIEKAVAKLASKTLVYGYRPGDWFAPVYLSAHAETILS